MATNKSIVFWEHLQAAITDLWGRMSTALARKVNSTTYIQGMNGKADVGHTHLISDVEGLEERLQAIAAVGTEPEKEVVTVDTYTDLEDVEEPTNSVIYITADDNKLYLYDESNEEFVEITNEKVDSTIYVNDLDALFDMDFNEQGVFTVIHIQLRGSLGTIYSAYSLVIESTLRRGIGRVITVMRLYLVSRDGWAEEYTNSNTSVWKWHKYAYEAVPVTYDDLLYMCRREELVAGQKYRITDYVTTVYDEENEARSAGHPFDLLVTAVSSSKLAAEAIPLHTGRDLGGYFADFDLEACKVWYDINNDTTKYKWADEQHGKGVIYRMKDKNGNDLPYDFWNVQFKRYAISDITSSKLTADALANLKSTYCYDENGGKCFATKDVYGNWVPQDGNGVSYEFDETTFDWYYTFQGFRKEADGSFSEQYDMSTHPLRLSDECIQYLEEDGCGSDIEDKCSDNVIKPAYNEYFQDDEYYKGRRVLNNMVFLCESYCYYNDEDEYWDWSVAYCYGNKFGVECKSNTFGNYCYRNTFGNYCSDNSFANWCSDNTFGNNVRYLTVFDGVQYVAVTGGNNSSSYVQNAQILNGTKGYNEGNRLSITFAQNANYCQLAGLNSSGNLRIWTPADAA